MASIIRYICFWLFIAGFASNSFSAPPPTYDHLIQLGNSQLQAGGADQAFASSEAAIAMNDDRREGYALAGGALMKLNRLEKAADTLSKAIERAPESKQPALRNLRRQCLLSDPRYRSVGSVSAPAEITSQAEIVLWQSIENSWNPADFQSYLNQYPHGAFTVLAQRHLEEAKELSLTKEMQDREATWNDPRTGYTWTRHLVGPVDLQFAAAMAACSSLRLLGYSNWRLPKGFELASVNTESRGTWGRHHRQLRNEFQIAGEVGMLWVTTSSDWSQHGPDSIFVNYGDGPIGAVCVRDGA